MSEGRAPRAISTILRASRKAPLQSPHDGMQVSRQTSMRGDRFRQCPPPPRRWDLCPIPKISDIFQRGPTTGPCDDESPALSLERLFSPSLRLLPSHPRDDEFVRPLAAEHLGARTTRALSKTRTTVDAVLFPSTELWRFDDIPAHTRTVSREREGIELSSLGIIDVSQAAWLILSMRKNGGGLAD